MEYIKDVLPLPALPTIIIKNDEEGKGALIWSPNALSQLNLTGDRL
jgi:hypothetical protein